MEESSVMLENDERDGLSTESESSSDSEPDIDRENSKVCRMNVVS